MSRETNARKTMIVGLLEGYISSQAQITTGVIDAYARAVEPYSLEAVAQACDRFARGNVPGHNNSFPPTAAELAEQARVFDALLNPDSDDEPKLIAFPIGGRPPEGFVPLGPTSVDFGAGRIDMSKMHPREKEAILTAGGRVHNVASLAKPRRM